jgi:hypothetical protein
MIKIGMYFQLLYFSLKILARVFSNVVGLWSHAKGRAHMGGMGIGRNLKT